MENERFRVGDQLLLKRPNGSKLGWPIGGIEWPCPLLPNVDFAILLEELTKNDVPIGTEVWSVDRTASESSQDGYAAPLGLDVEINQTQG
jgi:hypothetical protein